MEFSSNQLKQVHMQMYNIWVGRMLQIAVLVMNYEKQCSYRRNMLESYGEQYSPAQTALSGS